jgi:hypothetical protein
MGYLMQFRAGVIVEVCCKGSEGKVYGGTRQKTAGWARVGVWKRKALQIIQHNWNAKCSERSLCSISLASCTITIPGFPLKRGSMCRRLSLMQLGPTLQL